MKKKYYLHVLSRNGFQTICTSEDENKKKLNRLQTEGWILQDTKEYTDINIAFTQKRLLEQSIEHNGRPLV